MRVLAVVLTILVADHSTAEAPLPASFRQLGWKMGDLAKPEGEGVTVELCGDFQCPDTLAAWDDVILPLLLWIKTHAHPVTVYYRASPLPYHATSYSSALAAIVATDMQVQRGGQRAAAFEGVATQLLRQRARYFSKATERLTEAQVLEQVLWPIVQGTGLPADAKAAFVEAMHKRSHDLDLRVSWKAACARTVTGTPTFAFDGVISAAAADWSLQKWKEEIENAL